MGKGQGFESGDWIKTGLSIAAATAGAVMAGPAGAAAGWQLGSTGGDFLTGATGMEKSGSGVAGLTQKVGDVGSMVGGGMSVAKDGGQAASQMWNETGATGASLLTPKAGVSASDAISGFSKASEKTDLFGAVSKALELGNAASGLFGTNNNYKSAESNLQPMQMNVQHPSMMPISMNQVVAASLMNPASQNRLAFRGRM